MHVIQTVVVEKDALRAAAYHDSDWTRLPWRGATEPSATPLPRPDNLAAMIALAERLGRDFDHVRVDLYDTGARIYAGELTLYCWSGLMYFDSDEPDRVLGALWKIRRPMTRACTNVLLRERKIAPSGASG